MHNLKNKILEIFTQHDHTKSTDAESNIIIFNAFRNKYRMIQRLSDLFLDQKNTKFPCTSEIEEDAIRMAQLRAKGIPLQHITGNQYFYDHDYVVNSNVLIPRPETEILISEVVQFAKKRWSGNTFRFAELGLGSGILSTEILYHCPKAIGIASEVNHQAIALARQNLDLILGYDHWEQRFSIIEPAETYVGFEIFADYKPMDLIVSNPPYVSVNDEIESEVLRHEPHTALFPMLGAANAGEKENPNFFYENFLYHHEKILKTDGIVFFEIPHERADSIVHKFKNAGFQHVKTENDLTGRPRVLIAQK
jgi:release factor glutamine methyltransferase